MTKTVPLQMGMTVTLGARLRLHREQRDIALSAIAEETKIKVSLLEALERDDVSPWPKGIFRRAYLRAYARAIGVDPNVVVREFLALYPDPDDILPLGVTVWPDPTVDDVASASGRFRLLVRSARAAAPSFLQGPETDPPTTAPAAGSDRPRDRDSGSVDEGPQVLAVGPSVVNAMPTVPGVSLGATADLCARLARVQDLGDVLPILADAARLIDAVGLVVWSWDRAGNALRCWLAYGYSDTVLARMPTVPRDADNAVAVAFRAAEVAIVESVDNLTGAVVVPLVMPWGCPGVLAIELRDGAERCDGIRAFATIVAAQLGMLLALPPLAEAVTA